MVDGLGPAHWAAVSPGLCWWRTGVGGRSGVGMIGHPALGTAEVKRLYVRPAERGAGIGTTLMDHVHRHAGLQGFTRVILEVLHTRAGAVAFYRHLGCSGGRIPHDRGTRSDEVVPTISALCPRRPCTVSVAEGGEC